MRGIKSNLLAIAMGLVVWIFSYPITIRAGFEKPQNSTQEPLALQTSIETGGKPDALTGAACADQNEIIFIDRSTASLRFLDAISLTLSADTFPLASLDNDRWLAFDRTTCLAYTLTTRQRWNFGTIPWREAQLHVVARHELTATISINETYNLNLTNPPDSKYAVDGLAIKPANVEAGNPTRLVVDNNPGGRIDVIDMGTRGVTIARAQRFAYREPITTSWQTNAGNTLALDTNHQTLAVDDLTTTDRLYIADKNHEYDSGYGYIRVVRLNHPLQDLNAALLPEVDLNGTWPFANGLAGLDMAGRRDRLYVASGLQSFNYGYLGSVNTTNHSAVQVINIPYGDLGKVLVDWHDTRRVFIVTFDGFYNDPDQGLYLHLVYDTSVIDSLQLLKDYDSSIAPFQSMAFDPYTRRLFIGIGSQIMVVSVDYGAAPIHPPYNNHLYLPENYR